jgi:hypothetical protein
MAGYSRQSTADIIPTAVVKSAPVNAEFNAIRDAFAFSTGHKHDGSSTEGAYIPLIADVDANNKIVVDTANNRHGVFVEVSSAAVEQIRFQDGVIIPVTNNDIDLGSSSFKFKDAYVDGTGYIDTIVATGNATIGGTFAVTSTSTFTGAISAGSITATGTATLATVDINAGAIDNTVIGATTKAAGSFTTVTTTGQATLATADINGGTIDGAVIGGASAAAITGTTITANTGFTGALTGNVTGNVTGDLTGNVTGNVTGNLTGNVTASSGSSSFNDVVINGTLNMNAGTTATITNLTSPTNANDAATKGYVDTAVANLVDAAPGALDTLNELAAAINDDANFSTTITNSIATKLPLAGGTMSGAIAMGTNKITGMGDPTANQDAATKVYVDTQRDTRLALAGGTMTGAISMGANKITATYTPSANSDLTTKTYVDGILGSATSAAASAAAAATSASNAATSATSASNSASAAAASYDAFDDRYLGSKSSDPSVDNDGNALLVGALYFNTTSNEMKVWSGSAWLAAYASLSGALIATNNLSDLDNVATARTNLGLEIGVDVQAYDANILTSSDIGVTVQAYDANILTSSDIGTSVQAYDATIVVDADIGVSVQAYDSNLTSFVTAVNLPTADGTAGQFLKTDGAGTVSFADIPTINTLDDVGDVTITSAATGEALIWNGSAWVNGSVSALDTQTTSTSSTSQTTLATYAVADYDGVKAVITVADSTAGERTIVEMLITHDGTTAVATEYAIVNTDTKLAEFDVDISTGNVRLLATPASSNSMSFTVKAITL